MNGTAEKKKTAVTDHLRTSGTNGRVSRRILRK
jgi:hypothetical protein